MKTLLLALVLASLPSPKLAPRSLSPEPSSQHIARARVHGRWYMARDGHAIYCYGPVVTLDDPGTGPKRFATYCRGEAPMVELRD